MRDWPLLLAAAALLLGSAAKTIADGLDWFSGLTAGLGAAAIGAWLSTIDRNKMEETNGHVDR